MKRHVNYIYNHMSEGKGRGTMKNMDASGEEFFGSGRDIPRGGWGVFLQGDFGDFREISVRPMRHQDIGKILGAAAGSDGAVKPTGARELSDFFEEVINDDLMKGAPRIFMAKAEDVAYITSLNTADAINSGSGDDTADHDIRFCVIITPGRAARLREILAGNGYSVYEHASGGGFQAEMDGVRMAFLFPLGEAEEKGGPGASRYGRAGNT